MQNGLIYKGDSQSYTKIFYQFSVRIHYTLYNFVMQPIIKIFFVHCTNVYFFANINCLSELYVYKY